MLDGAFYQPVYLGILTILTIILSIKYQSYPASRIIAHSKENFLYSLLLFIFMSLFIGFRPLHRVFVDMNNYNQYFIFMKIRGGEFVFDVDTENLIFDNLFSYLCYNDYKIEVFFLVIAVIYFGCITWSIRRFFPYDTFYALVIYLSAFSTFSYGTNGIKAGAAAAIFLVAISYRNKIWLSLLLALLSWGFHHSMYMVISAYIVTLFVKDSRYFMVFWLLCIFFSLLHINPLNSLMIDLADETGTSYLTSTNEAWGGNIGFRLDFLIYSAVPIAIGYYIIFKQKITDVRYTMLFNLYLLSNSLWVLCMYIPFNNRIAYLSWFMLPIVSVYPMMNLQLQPGKYKLLNKVAYVYLGFTLLMSFI